MFIDTITLQPANP